MHPELHLIEQVLAQARIDAAGGCPEALEWLGGIVEGYAPPPDGDMPAVVAQVLRGLLHGSPYGEVCALARVSNETLRKWARLYPSLAQALEAEAQRLEARQFSALFRRKQPRSRRAA